MRNKSNQVVSIQKVAKSFNLSSRMLRHWVELGLIETVPGKYSRHFDAFNIAKIPTILALHESSLQLKAIKSLLSLEDNESAIYTFQEKLNLVSQSYSLLLALCPHHGDDPIQLAETVLHDIKTACYQKWIKTPDDGIQFYQNCLIDFVNAGKVCAPTYSIFCDYPSLNFQGTEFDYNKGFLMRVFIPITDEFFEITNPEERIVEEDFFAQKIEYFDGLRGQYVEFHHDQAVSVTFTGDRNKSLDAYAVLFNYLKANNYTPVGTPHEIYLRDFAQQKAERDIVVKITIPIKKKLRKKSAKKTTPSKKSK